MSTKQAKLNLYLSTTAHAPYKRGEMDCVRFVAGAVYAMTGRDYLKGFESCKTKRAGLCALKAAGFGRIDAFLDAHFDAKDSIDDAAFGDIARVKAGLGLVQGSYIYVRTATGLGLLALNQAIKIWGVRDNG